MTGAGGHDPGREEDNNYQDQHQPTVTENQRYQTERSASLLAEIMTLLTSTPHLNTQQNDWKI